MPVLKLSLPGCGLQPQQPGRVVVVVVAGVVVVVVVTTGVVVVVVATGVVVVVVATGVVVVVVATGVVVVVVAMGVVVVVVAMGVVVVVLLVGAPQASQQLGADPTDAVPPVGALQSAAVLVIEHVVCPLLSVVQQVTKPGLPQVECAAQEITVSSHSGRSDPSATAAAATASTQLTYA